MKSLFNKIKSLPKEFWIKNSFLVPILSVVGISIAHVITWYDLGNPIAWAIYLSIAIEIFALASVSAASIKVSKGSIWFLFIIVTLIQIIGNVFFIYQFIDITNETFLSWVELIEPWFIGWELVDHKRLLALIQGGTLPFMSLIALHFYIKFNEDQNKESIDIIDDDKDIEKSKNAINKDIDKNDIQEEPIKEDMVSDKVLKESLKQKQEESEKQKETSNDEIVKDVKKRTNKASNYIGRTKRDRNKGNDPHPQTTPGI